MRRKSIMILAAVLIILVAAVVTVISVWPRDAPVAASVGAVEHTNSPVDATPESVSTPTAAPKLEIDPNAGELITPTPAPQEPGVAIPGWGSIALPAGVTEAQVALQNPDANADWYYLTFELRLPTTDAETGEAGYEVLFTTGLIPPGQYCNGVTLNRPLEPGEYAAVIHVQPYRMTDQSPTNNADMETTLVVK